MEIKGIYFLSISIQGQPWLLTSLMKAVEKSKNGLGRIFQTMRQAAHATGITVAELRAMKAEGCSAFGMNTITEKPLHDFRANCEWLPSRKTWRVIFDAPELELTAEQMTAWKLI